jgi:Na+-driven multidrug efflux pump
MFLVTLLSAAETYFVSSLGTDAIAAASLVVPVTPCCEVQLLD